MENTHILGIGNTDKPITSIKEDSFGIDMYVDGLGKFIDLCNTPMTIAIQGDWGSGKTSFMNMIRKERNDEKIKTIWFNTWQFSQFNLGDMLPITMMTALIESIEHDYKKKVEINNLLSKAARIGLMVAGGYLGQDFNAMESSLNDNSVVNTLTVLKEKFQESINESLNKTKQEKMVIFIDDLDRLAPQKAVELLEVLKIFLDCDKCVFVLAVDYAVVLQGMSVKYGNTINSEKGKDFFDKIIQVPFKVPINHFDIKKFVDKSLKGMGIDEENHDNYIKLIRKSIGPNPRGINRIMNAFHLLNLIYEDDSKNKKPAVLFGVLCLQMFYENVYNYIVRNESENDEKINRLEFFPDTSVEDETDTSEELKRMIKTLEIEESHERILDFLKEVRGVLNMYEKDKDKASDILDKYFDLTDTTTNIIDGKEVIGTRYTRILDKEIKEISLKEDVEDYNASWRSSIISSYTFDGVEKKCNRAVEFYLGVLNDVYARKPKEFEELSKDPEKHRVKSVFKEKDSFKSPRQIEGTDISVETHSGTAEKWRQLKSIVGKVGLPLDIVKVKARLTYDKEYIQENNR